MLTGVDSERAPRAQSSASNEIEVRRAQDPEAAIVAAARAWAMAFEARQQNSAPPGEGAELALYDALADVTALKRAELALYQAILASELMSK